MKGANLVLIKYLGSKRKLVDDIGNLVQLFPSATSVMDLFSGTARVGHHLKGLGYQVMSNDHNAYAETIARCYVQSDLNDHGRDAQRLIEEFNRIEGKPGYFTQTFCIDSRFFQPKNGERVDAIRDAIAAKSLDPELESVVLVALMEAADRVDSTTGVQMAYLKKWAARAENELHLRLPDLRVRAVHGKSKAYRLEALEAAGLIDADIAYIDPPYNQHSYLGNYHIWESLVLWDKPEVYGIANKRVDVKDRKSVYNSKPAFKSAFRDLLLRVNAKAMIISFNDEGYIGKIEMEALLSELYDGDAVVETLSHDYKRYVGAQIGIHNLVGEKVGTVSHLRNQEFLFVVSHPEFERMPVSASAKEDFLF
jgi:adenine-specific DNA-methyltransferase